MFNEKALSLWSFSSQNSSAKKMRKILELSLCDDGNGSSSGKQPQDADFETPCLSHELEATILARFPVSQHWKLCVLNKQFLSLLKSNEIYKIRRGIGLREPSVFMLASGESSWRAFDRDFKSCRKLPVVPSDYSFECGDKESFSAGTNLFVSGKEIDGAVIWRYELAKNGWFKSPSMITPRCSFASASCGIFAFVAGGLETTNCREVLKSAERYNSETRNWEPLPAMKRQRKRCSGCYMDNQFYVIGGQDLTCGESFDQETNRWTLIPDMLKDIPLSSSRTSPPLVAVANNELYTIDAFSNELKVYLKGSNSWKKLGAVPVRAYMHRGWGVAFKSLGNELLLIGDTAATTFIYTCCPDPAVEESRWTPIVCSSTNLNPFIRNCAVMLA